MDLPREIEFSKTRAAAVPAALRLAARQRIAQCVQKAHTLGVRLAMPTVSFDLRGKTAGQAYLSKNHVRLNAVLLMENAEHFIEQTVGHELAHLAAHVKHGGGIAAHGPEWRAMMVAFGLPPERCHRYDVSNAAVGKAVAFRCACPEPHLLSARRAVGAARGRYRCRACGTALRPADAPARPPESSRIPTRPAQAMPNPGAGSTARPPTDAMLRYARDLAAQTGLSFPLAATRDFDACSRFIEQARAVRRPEPPTERQLEYAKRLAARAGTTIPPTALASRKAMSDWIDAQQPVR